MTNKATLLTMTIQLLLACQQGYNACIHRRSSWWMIPAITPLKESTDTTAVNSSSPHKRQIQGKV
jgi:hypothetical protein